MKKSLLSAATSMLGVALALPPVANLQAAELNVLAGGAMTGPMQELGTQFERASGHKLVFRFGAAPELVKLATSGGAVYPCAVPPQVMKNGGAPPQVRARPAICICASRP